VIVDTHTHLDQPVFDEDRDLVIERAEAAGVGQMICVGIDRPSSEAAVALARRHGSIHAAAGIHPNSVAEARPDDFSDVEQLALDGRIVAIGETGLDRHWDFTPFDRQRESFVRHLELSQRCELPVIIHCREAEDDVLDVLRAHGGKSVHGILHAFSGDARFAAACLELGLHISFAGMVSYTNRKFRPLRDVAQSIRDDRLLIETDSPYLVPHPLRGKCKRNEPALIRHTAESLAELRGVSVEELITLTSANACRLLGLDGSDVASRHSPLSS
jgi:TatD DNase family protein